MTWSSAVGYWRGTRASWKARDYGRSRPEPIAAREAALRNRNVTAP